MRQQLRRGTFLAVARVGKSSDLDPNACGSMGAQGGHSVWQGEHVLHTDWAPNGALLSASPPPLLQHQNDIRLLWPLTPLPVSLLALKGLGSSRVLQAFGAPGSPPGLLTRPWSPPSALPPCHPWTMRGGAAEPESSVHAWAHLGPQRSGRPRLSQGLALGIT